MKSCVPDVAAQGGGGGGGPGPDGGTAMAAQTDPIWDTARGVFTFLGAALGTGKADWGR